MPVPILTPQRAIDVLSTFGRPVTRGGEQAWWFGCNPSDPAHTAEVVRPFADEPILLTAPRVMLTDYARIVNGGKHPPYSWQQSGSCVNSGANNALRTRSAIDICIGKGAGVFTIPFTLAAYAYSRYKAFGDQNPGEGSTGDAMAMALRDLGNTEFDTPELLSVLPRPKVYDIAVTYTKAQELQWSAWRNVPQAVRDASAGSRIEYVNVTTLEQAEAEIRKARPLTVAGNWGSRMQMSYRGSGANRVLFGDYAANWEHQQSIHGVWLHPEFGRLWYWMNNWYMDDGGVIRPVHGDPGTDEPPGGYWTDDSAVQHQLSYRFGEIRSIKSLVPYDQGALSHVAV